MANQTMVAVPSNGVVVGKMKRTNSTKTIKQIMKNESKYRFDLAIQRNTVWSDIQKSMLINSIMEEFPIPLVFIRATDDGYFWMIDGKQRFTTIFDFINEKFPLHKDTPSVTVERVIKIEGKEDQTAIEEVEVEGKYFSELDKELQDDILDYSMSIVEIKNITDEQVEELFQRLNAGSPLTAMELTRAMSGTKTMEFVDKISKTTFFSDFASISVAQRNRYTDNELIMQIMMLLAGRQSDLGSKEIKEFASSLREVGIETVVDETPFFATIDYLEKAFETFDGTDAEKNRKIRNRMLKKVHIPVLFLTAQETAAAGVDPVEFGKWAYQFLVVDKKKNGTNGATYNNYCGSATHKWNKVAGRIKTMQASARETFNLTAQQEVAASTEE